MLDDAVRALLGETDTVKAWKSLIRPDDVVGIKTNAWRYIPTTVEVEQAIKRRVMDAGVGEDRIAIDDRGVLRDPVFQKATALVNARPMRTHHWSGVGSLIKNYIMFTPQPSAWHGDTCADLAAIWELPGRQGQDPAQRPGHVHALSSTASGRTTTPRTTSGSTRASSSAAIPWPPTPRGCASSRPSGKSTSGTTGRCR